ncbi:MAG: MarP family serine protease [bacterium]
MNIADLLIVVLVIFMVYRGLSIGFTREIFATTGFIISIIVGVSIIPLIIRHMTNTSSKALWAISLMIVSLFIFVTAGEMIGYYLKVKIARKAPLEKTDKILGGVLRFAGTIIIVWIVGSILIKFPNVNVQSQVQQSYILGQINKDFPSTPKFISSIDSIISPNGFPLAFVGNEPLVNSHISLNSTPELDAAVNADQKSVVKVEGLGCGGIVEGSGFVAANNLVITNAHVVAGILKPYVYDTNGQHSAVVVYFNPSLDLAIIRTSNLAGLPLKINNSLVNDSTIGAVMGYPGGGQLQAKTAAILSQLLANGRNIYNQGMTVRSIYALQADIQPGNSGGPFIDSNGQVDGLVFAKSTAYANQGYALTMVPVVEALQSNLNSYNAVSTGQCAE